MKKLMITMAVATAIGLVQAELTGMATFEGDTVSDALNLNNGGAREWDTTGETTGTDPDAYVVGTEVKAYGPGEARWEDVGSKYLALDGLDQPLQRYAQAGGTVYEIPKDGIYIDTRVKFTVSEDDAPEAGPGDKLCVWVGVDPVSGATNLMVKAGYIEDQFGTTASTNYVVTGAFPDGNIEGWHRLTVIAYTQLDEDNWLGSGFAIKIDGNLVGTELCPFADPSTFTFNDNVKAYMASSPYQLFPSLIAVGDDNSQTLTSVGFQGSGSIDNVQFTTDPIPQPEPVIPTYELTVPSVEHATPTVTTNEVKVTDLTAIPSNTEVVVTWTAEDGYKITLGATETITMDSDKTAATPTVVAITYATLTIVPVDNCTIVVSNATDEVATGTQFDKDDAVLLTVYRTPAEGYELVDGCAATENITMTGDITVTAAVKKSGGSGYDSGDGEHTFTIASEREAVLTAALPEGATSLADKVSETSDLTYAQAYALGLWSENSAKVEDLDATITVGADGKVTVSLANAPASGYLVTCKVYQKASLTAEWPAEPTETYAYGSEVPFTPAAQATAGFYKIEVVISNALQN